MDDLDVLRPAEPGDAPTVPGLAARSPIQPTGPGVHRRDEDSSPPWLWLAGAMVLALLATFGLTWLVGDLVDGGTRPRARPPAVTSSLASSDPVRALELPPKLPAATAETTTAATATPLLTAVPATPSPVASSTLVPVPTRPTTPLLVRVPDVVSDRQGAASATLRAAGFAVSTVPAPAPSPRLVRRVLTQTPGGGQLARPGTRVVLVVGSR